VQEVGIARENGIVRGPGVYDMKGGLVEIVFALRALAELGVEPAVTPVVVVNTDEEIGSPESRRHLRRLARPQLALVLEGAYGPDGKLKTARKSVGRFTLLVRGRAAHAGVNPEAGASAILELSHQVQRLFALNDRVRGITVNVGQIDGGLRPNVIAAEAQRRSTSGPRGRRGGRGRAQALDRSENVEVEVTGLRAPPLKPTPRTARSGSGARGRGELGLAEARNPPSPGLRCLHGDARRARPSATGRTHPTARRREPARAGGAASSSCCPPTASLGAPLRRRRD
jgi:glutamate carboxypeptidase